VINKTFLLIETVEELAMYQNIKLMKEEHAQTLLVAQQYTHRTLQLPLVNSMIESKSIVPYAIRLTKAQSTLSQGYKFVEVWDRDDCREAEKRLHLVCPINGGPENFEEMTAVYTAARAAAGGVSSADAHAAGVSAARAIARLPDASSAGARVDSDRAEDYGLAAVVPGGYHFSSGLGCSCQLRMHHG
jgi:hypothetical protein